jgi:ankyrin repeat protein
MSIPVCPTGLFNENGEYQPMDRNYNNTKLFDAVRDNNLELAKHLIIHKCMNVNEKNGAGETPIFYAVYNDNLEMVKLLVENNAELNIKTYYGSPLLLNCLKNKNNNIVKYLLVSNIDINIADNGKSLLYYCLSGNQELLDLLLERNDLNANVQHGDWGTTPLLIAVGNGDTNLIKKLIDRGADVNLKSYNGSSPLSTAYDSKQYDIVELLLKYNAFE